MEEIKKDTVLPEQCLNELYELLRRVKFPEVKNKTDSYFSSGDGNVIYGIMKYLAKNGYTVEEANKILDATKIQLTRIVLTEDNPAFNLC